MNNEHADYDDDDDDDNDYDDETTPTFYLPTLDSTTHAVRISRTESHEKCLCDDRCQSETWNTTEAINGKSKKLSNATGTYA